MTHLNNSTRFPECDAMVGILNSRYAAVWIDIGVGLLLEAIKLDPRCLIGQIELLKNDQDLGWVGNLV